MGSSFFEQLLSAPTPRAIMDGLLMDSSSKGFRILLCDVQGCAALAQRLSAILAEFHEPLSVLSCAITDPRQPSRVRSAFQSALVGLRPHASFLLASLGYANVIVELLRDADALGHGPETLVILDPGGCSGPVSPQLDGLNGYLVPPLEPDKVFPCLARSLGSPARRSPLGPAHQIKERLGLTGFIGESDALMKVITQIPRIAACELDVLISGETGTGKELCARAIHQSSSRARNPFVPVNCGALTPELFENELFGHEPGAYTGAGAASTGLAQHARGGTLFLDELDALAPSSQVRVLRFLQDREVRKVGSGKTGHADVRVLAATNCDIEQALRAGKLRQDLFHRLNAAHLSMPPLRARDGDVSRLAKYFLKAYAAKFQGSVLGFTTQALARLTTYGWPGNVRELANTVVSAMLGCKGERIDADDIELPQAPQPDWPRSFRSEKETAINDFEREFLRERLAACHGNITKAAEAAGLERRNFVRLLRKHGLGVIPPPE